MLLLGQLTHLHLARLSFLWDDSLAAWQREFDVGAIMNISAYGNSTVWGQREACQSRRNAFVGNTWCNLTDSQNVRLSACWIGHAHMRARTQCRDPNSMQPQDGIVASRVGVSNTANLC